MTQDEAPMAAAPVALERHVAGERRPPRAFPVGCAANGAADRDSDRGTFAARFSLVGLTDAPSQRRGTRRRRPDDSITAATCEHLSVRIGGTYDLDRPQAWASGGEGGVTLESLGAGSLRLGYVALGTPGRDARGEITNALGRVPDFM